MSTAAAGSSSDDTDVPGRFARRSVGLSWALAVACTLPLWSTPVLPSTDGPSHLYNAWLLLHFEDEVPGAARYFDVVPFVPNWGGVGPLVPLLALFEPSTAEKVYASVLVALLVLAWAALVRRLGGDAVLAAGSAGILAHGWLLAAGFTGFLLSLGLGTALCATGVPAGADDRRGGRRLARTLFLTLGFGLLFFVHLAGAAIAIALWLAIGGAALFEGVSWRRVAARFAPPAALLGALCLAHFARTAGRIGPAFRPDPRGPWGRLAELPLGSYWEAYAADDRRVGLALFVLTVGLVVLAATGRVRGSTPARALALGAGAVLVSYAIVPWALVGGAFVTDRLVPLIFLLPLPWATSRGLRARTLLRAAMVALLVGALAQRASEYRFWGQILASLTEANRDLPTGRFLVQPEAPRLQTAANPLTHAWGRIAIERRAIALDDYEASLDGFPLSFNPAGRALVAARRERGEWPPGTVVMRTR